VQDVLSFARPSDPKLETIAADTIIREVQGLVPRMESRGLQLVSNPARSCSSALTAPFKAGARKPCRTPLKPWTAKHCHAARALRAPGSAARDRRRYP